MNGKQPDQTTQIVYLVRHGEAKSKNEDPDRSLTERGRKDVEQIVSRAVAAGLQIDEIRHSGILRAEQTAQLLAENLNPPSSPIAVSGLDPNDDVRPIASLLRQENRPVMLVGHLPFLSYLVSHMVHGNADQTVPHFETGTLIILSRQGDKWSIMSVMHPDRAG